MLRIVEPRVRRHRSEEEEDEAAPAPAILSVEGEAAGMRWLKELQRRKRERILTYVGPDLTKYALFIKSIYLLLICAYGPRIEATLVATNIHTQISE